MEMRSAPGVDIGRPDRGALESGRGAVLHDFQRLVRTHDYLAAIAPARLGWRASRLRIGTPSRLRCPRPRGIAVRAQRHPEATTHAAALARRVRQDVGLVVHLFVLRVPAQHVARRDQRLTGPAVAGARAGQPASPSPSRIRRRPTGANGCAFAPTSTRKARAGARSTREQRIGARRQTGHARADSDGFPGNGRDPA